MNDLVQMMVNYRCFRQGDPESVEKLLKTEYNQNKNRTPYFIRFDPKSPGYFVLTWYYGLSSHPVKREAVKVTPEGYQIRNKTFSTPSELISWFKKEASNLAQPRPPSNPTSVATPSHVSQGALGQPPTGQGQGQGQTQGRMGWEAGRRTDPRMAHGQMQGQYDPGRPRMPIHGHGHGPPPPTPPQPPPPPVTTADAEWGPGW
mmetsp:Transcript_9542/g.9580  ORF Transcript_9542/g.9580 Transcript_9542/m.9580 type:complete len:203 (-) Transcript_9542:202-810(-)